MSAPHFSLFGPAFRANPYPTYAEMRAKAPIYSHVNQRTGAKTWFITRYNDAIEVLRDHERFAKNYRNTLTAEEQAELPEDPPLLGLVSHHMLNMDPPDHTRLRSLVNKAFTVRLVEQLEARMVSIAHELIDRVEPTGRMDLIEDYAFPLPVIVIAELLGVPVEDRGRFRAWSHAIVTPTPDAKRTAKKLEKSRGTMENFIAYLRRISEERRINPGDDLLSLLLAAEEAGDRLSEDELFSMVLLLIVVGHETSVNLIGNGMLALLNHPASMTQLREAPAMMPLAVEEMLRYDCPVERAPMRFATTDTDLSGETIRRGDLISVVLGSANRDETEFERADQFEIERSPNRHIAFGFGIHYCLGAPLARSEGRIAINALFERLPPMHLAIPSETLRWGVNPIMRGLQRLPVEWSIQ